MHPPPSGSRMFFSLQPETLYPLSSHFLCPSPSPWQAPVCVLSLWICRFHTFPINGIIHSGTFCVWLLANYVGHSTLKCSLEGSWISPPGSLGGYSKVEVRACLKTFTGKKQETADTCLSPCIHSHQRPSHCPLAGSELFHCSSFFPFF